MTELPDLGDVPLRRPLDAQLDEAVAAALVRILEQLDAGGEPVAGFQSAV